jgi:hypothetical protein
MRLTYTQLYNAHTKGDDWPTQTAWKIVEKLRIESGPFDELWCVKMKPHQRDVAFNAIRDVLNKSAEVRQ